jgi:uncharacterized damage-inducible protein DinB
MKTSLVRVLGCTLTIWICLQTATVLAQSPAPPSSRPFIDHFQSHWTTAKELALAVADAMPAEDYNFKPVPAEMSFGEQMLHIASASSYYCAFIADTKSPYTEPAADAKVEKAAALKVLGDSFDYCSKVFDGLDESKLSQMHGKGNRSLATEEVMLEIMIHMAHHRGQAEVSLRLKGITPPKYRW